jgi:hypothetical protein
VKLWGRKQQKRYIMKKIFFFVFCATLQTTLLTPKSASAKKSPSQQTAACHTTENTINFKKLDLETHKKDIIKKLQAITKNMKNSSPKKTSLTIIDRITKNVISKETIKYTLILLAFKEARITLTSEEFAKIVNTIFRGQTVWSITKILTMILGLGGLICLK